jgi:hypothetical protein
MFSVHWWLTSFVIVIFLTGSLCSRKAPDRTPLVLRGASPHAICDAVFQRPGQALDLRRAQEADPFRLVNLAQRVPGRADREEQVRIGVAAGGILAPVHAYSHRPGSSWLVSADDTQGELRRAATFHQPGNLMPVDAVGVDLGQ